MNILLIIKEFRTVGSLRDLKKQGKWYKKTFTQEDMVNYIRKLRDEITESFRLPQELVHGKSDSKGKK
jgi:hypothetical protein